MRQGRLPFLTMAAMLVAGCAAHRVDAGVFHSPKGYRVTMPNPGWMIVSEDHGGGDLVLRDATGRAGILINANCDAGRARRPLALLERRLLHGLARRTTIEHGEATVNGRPAAHSVLEAANDATGSRLRIETFVVSDGHCVFDLVYAAEPDVFAAGRDTFARFVQSFATE